MKTFKVMMCLGGTYNISGSEWNKATEGKQDGKTLQQQNERSLLLIIDVVPMSSMW